MLLKCDINSVCVFSDDGGAVMQLSLVTFMLECLNWSNLQLNEYPWRLAWNALRASLPLADKTHDIVKKHYHDI